MEMAKVKSDFENDVVYISVYPYISLTSSGHYSSPNSRSNQAIMNVTEEIK